VWKAVKGLLHTGLNAFPEKNELLWLGESLPAPQGRLVGTP
jgi:hypothetical protein